jgi:hypothetical protein
MGQRSVDEIGEDLLDDGVGAVGQVGLHRPDFRRS